MAGHRKNATRKGYKLGKDKGTETEYNRVRASPPGDCRGSDTSAFRKKVTI